MKYAQLFLRLAVGAAFLSAVADRLGFWGRPGQLNIAWGNFENFQLYTHQLVFFVGAGFSNILAVVATVLEAALGLLLLLGYRIKWSGRLSGCLLALFAMSMSMALGIKSAFDYSVWVGSGACFLLATIPAEAYSFSLDGYLARKNKV